MRLDLYYVALCAQDEILMLVAGPFRSQDVAKHAMQSNNEKGNLKVVLFANVGYEYLEVLTP